jgi:hypothetical protein
VHDQSILLESEFNINDIYSSSFLKVSKYSMMRPGNSLHLTVLPAKWQVIKTITVPNTVQKRHLVLNNKEIYIFSDDLSSKEYNLTFLFKSYYADVIYFLDRGNPRILNISSKKGKKMVSFSFESASESTKVKEKLEELLLALFKLESDFIRAILKKYHADCIF